MEVKHGQIPAEVIAGLTSDLQAYFGLPQDYAWILNCFQQVKAWGARHGIPSFNIAALEHGATRDNTGFPNNVLGYSSAISVQPASIASASIATFLEPATSAVSVKRPTTLTPSTTGSRSAKTPRSARSTR